MKHDRVTLDQTPFIDLTRSLPRLDASPSPTKKRRADRSVRSDGDEFALGVRRIGFWFFILMAATIAAYCIASR